MVIQTTSLLAFSLSKAFRTLLSNCNLCLSEESSRRPIIYSRILEQIVDWMSFDCRLALTSIHQTQYIHSQRPTLWTSPTKPNTQTPIPGLVRWCTRAPLLIALQHSRTVRTSTLRFIRYIHCYFWRLQMPNWYCTGLFWLEQKLEYLSFWTMWLLITPF